MNHHFDGNVAIADAGMRDLHEFFSGFGCHGKRGVGDVSDRGDTNAPAIEVDVRKLRQFYFGFMCIGIIALIDFLLSPEGDGVLLIGSGSFVVGDGVPDDGLVEFFSKSLYIGSGDGVETPLQWFQRLTERFGEMSIAAREAFDNYCDELAMAAHTSRALVVSDRDL